MKPLSTITAAAVALMISGAALANRLPPPPANPAVLGTIAYENASLASETEVILLSNVSANSGTARHYYTPTPRPMFVELWLGGGKWDTSTSWSDTNDGLPVELFLRWRNSSGTWYYDTYLFPGDGSAYLRIPLPPSGVSGEDVELVIYNPRNSVTADISVRGKILAGEAHRLYEYAAPNVIRTPTSAVINRGYVTFCTRRPREAGEFRFYAAETDATATQRVHFAAYTPSHADGGPLALGLTSSTTSLDAIAYYGDLSCLIQIFEGTFANNDTATLRLFVSSAPYAP